MRKSTPEDYDNFYLRQGWHYDSASEYMFLVYRILQPLRIPHGKALLELGCGTGLHAALFAKLGFHVTAVDSSSVAITKAEESFPGLTFRCDDAHEFLERTPDETFDLVFVRGLSWFHYELGPRANRFGVDVQSETGSIIRVLKPGGFFILQIKTDFSGEDCPETGIRNHTWYDLAALLEPRGSLVLFTDWNGLPLVNAAMARASKANALCALRKQ